jgi:hypothetical protein
MRNRRLLPAAKHFIRAMQKRMAREIFCGHRVSLLVPGNKFLESDKPLAVAMGRKLILAWIQAISEMIRFSHKEKRAFVREWQSCLWEGEEVVNPIKDNRTIFLPVWGVTKATSKPKKSLDELVADFGSTVY